MRQRFVLRHQGKASITGDGQVTFGNAMVMKRTAKKVRRLYRGKVVAGFAGSVADALTIFEKFEAKLEEYNGNLSVQRLSLPKNGVSDQDLKTLGSHDDRNGKRGMLLISGNGEVIEPDDECWLSDQEEPMLYRLQEQ